MKHGLNTEIKASGEQLMNESFSLAHPCFIRGLFLFLPISTHHWPIYEIRPHRPKIRDTFIMCVFHVFVTGEFLCRQKLRPALRPAKRPGKNSPSQPKRKRKDEPFAADPFEPGSAFKPTLWEWAPWWR